MAGVLALASSAAPDQRSAALARDGWEAIRAGRTEEAADRFADAIKLDDRDANLHLGAALAAYLRGDAAEARAALERALQRDPRLTRASVLLGELHYRRGELDAAIRTYEEALAHAPADPELTRRLERWRKDAALQSGFRQTLGNHFTVLFEGPAEEALAAKAVEVLETAYWRVTTSLGVYPPDVITVVLYTQEQFRDIIRAPAWSAGSFDGRIRVPVRGALRDARELERVLAHEFTHALVRGLAPRGVPVWLNEGLAVYFEAVDLSAAEARLRRTGSALPLEALAQSFERLAADQVPLAYAQSGLAVRAMAEYSGMPAVAALVTDLAAGVPFGAAFERRILMTYEDFQRSLQEAWRPAR